MNEHQPEGNLAGKRMRFPKVKWPAREEMHCERPRDIEEKAGPEGSDMPWFEKSGNPFGPDTRGVEDQRERNQRRRQNQEQ
jgi:hypothetical protein